MKLSSTQQLVVDALKGDGANLTHFSGGHTEYCLIYHGNNGHLSMTEKRTLEALKRRNLLSVKRDSRFQVVYVLNKQVSP